MRKLTLLLIAASLVYIPFTGFLYFSYQNWIRQQYVSAPEQMRPYMDFAPFYGSGEGVVTIVWGASLGTAWVLHFSRQEKTDCESKPPRISRRLL